MEWDTKYFSSFQRQKVFSSFPSFVQAETLHKGLQLPQRKVQVSRYLVDKPLLPLLLLFLLLLFLLLLLLLLLPLLLLLLLLLILMASLTRARL